MEGKGPFVSSAWTVNRCAYVQRLQRVKRGLAFWLTSLWVYRETWNVQICHFKSGIQCVCHFASFCLPASWLVLFFCLIGTHSRVFGETGTTSCTTKLYPFNQCNMKPNSSFGTTLYLCNNNHNPWNDSPTPTPRLIFPYLNFISATWSQTGLPGTTLQLCHNNQNLGHDTTAPVAALALLKATRRTKIHFTHLSLSSLC